MPSITEPRNGLVEITDLLAAELAAGRSSRATLGSKSVAFGWAAGYPRTFADFASVALAESLQVGVVTVGPSATPVAKVARGGAKPSAVTIASGTLTLSKYAGLASWELEDSLSSEGLAAAVAETLIGGALAAYEADVAAALDAAATATVTADSWAEGILTGIGTIASNGGRAGVVAMNPADLAAAVEAPSNLVFSGTDAIPTLLGLAVHITPAVTAGKGYVFDPSALLCVEHVQSPVVIMDPFSAKATNTIGMVSDVVAGVHVVRPKSVAEVTVSAS